MKNKLIEFVKVLLKIFFVFPIKQNRVLFSSYSGRSYSCNPKYITEALLKSEKNLELIWAFVNPEDYNKLDEKIKKVQFKSIPYLYYSITSKIVVDNVEGWSILPRRKKQIVINTWHGGGAYKGVGLKRRDTSIQTDVNMLRKNERVSIYLSSSKFFTQATLRESFGYRGKVLEVGMPRNDLLINSPISKIEEIKASLGITMDTHIVIYAPTFRNDREYKYELDVGRLLKVIERKFGGNWTILVRTHYYVKQSNMDGFEAMNVSNYEDMQELLLISDILITDYSSSIWDFCLTGKPAFLYTPDLEFYSAERDFYTPIEDWPYPHANNFDSLEILIQSYDAEKAQIRIQKHLDSLKNCETGKATSEVVNYIMNNTYDLS